MKQDASQPLTPEDAGRLYATTPVDIAIVGSGPAGCSAAITARTRGRSVVIISADYKKNPLYKAPVIENMPGLPHITGADLLDRFHRHVTAMGAPIIEGSALFAAPFDIESKEHGPMPGFQIAYKDKFVMARTIILAPGILLGKPYEGEDRLLGRGVSYCATCDGMLFRNKPVAVIAKAPDALEEALHLTKIGCRVSLFVQPRDLKRWKQTVDADAFERVVDATSFKIIGDEVVEQLETDKGTFDVAGVFILRVGIAPDKMLSAIETDGPYVRVNERQQTSIEGVFAAGDCTGKPWQIACALGEGLTAALCADEHLSDLEKTGAT